MSAIIQKNLTIICSLCYKAKGSQAYAKKRNGYDSRCKDCKNRMRRTLYRRQRSRFRRLQDSRISEVVDVYAEENPCRDEDLRALEAFFLNLSFEVLMEK